jgi:hypothetical protein
MEQPLDLSITNTKHSFTIEYLTSNIHNQKRKPIVATPLLPIENQLDSHSKRFCLNSKFNEHVVPNVSTPTTTTVSELFYLIKKKFILNY